MGLRPAGSPPPLHGHRELVGCVLLLALPLVITPAPAAPIEFVFTGHVTDIRYSPLPGVAVGDPVLGHITFDSSVPATYTTGSYDAAIYDMPAPYGISATVGTVHIETLLTIHVVTQNDAINGQLWFVSRSLPGGPTLQVLLSSTLDAAVPDKTLPLVPPDLSLFEDRFFGLSPAVYLDAPFVEGRIETITPGPAVPEPASLALIGAGLLAGLAGRQRRPHR